MYRIKRNDAEIKMEEMIAKNGDPALIKCIACMVNRRKLQIPITNSPNNTIVVVVNIFTPFCLL